MQDLLSLEQAPPISAPLRFFLTAPLFAMLAGALLLYSGPDLLASRWTPGALAFTHLMTAGFMLQVMLGALQQLLPVVAGANIARPLMVATVVHATITLGALLLVAAFLVQRSWLFGCAAVLLGLGVMSFIWAAVRALLGLPGTSPIVRGLRMALFGLTVTVSIGVLLALALGGSITLPLVRLTNVHLGWGFVAWGCALVGVVGLVVVPMFQQTPAYPAWLERGFAYGALVSVLLWSVTELASWDRVASVLSVGVVLMVAIFALSTLRLQWRSKRATPDAAGRLWQVAMVSALAACVVWLAAGALPVLAQWQGWPLLLGVLVLFGGFVSVLIGMLGKIVPFLVWMHLHHRSQGRTVAPNIKKVLSQQRIDRQAVAHFFALGLLLLAVVWPAWFTYPAGAALVIAQAWLLHNLVSAMKVYRDHLVKIASGAA